MHIHREVQESSPTISRPLPDSSESQTFWKEACKNRRSGACKCAADHGHTDSHLWADTFDRKLKDIFAVESEIARNRRNTSGKAFTFRTDGDSALADEKYGRVPALSEGRFSRNARPKLRTKRNLSIRPLRGIASNRTGSNFALAYARLVNAA